MLNNYLKIALRQLLRNKSFSVINILGLAVGMSAVILILLWVQNEVGYDRFHSKKERIYELWNRGQFNGQVQCSNVTPKVAMSALKDDLPEVEKATRVNWSADYFISYGDKKLSLSGNAVDADFLDIFDFPLVEGDPHTALADGNSMVLTQTAAGKIFGKEPAVGKTVRVNNKYDVLVSGIVSDPPPNTRFDFECLLGWDFLLKEQEKDLSWGNNSSHNYVLLKENASLAGAQSKVRTLRRKYQNDEGYMDMFLYPITRWRMYSNFENGVETGGRIEYVRLFSVIAGLILLIACINFMNLSTARSEKRAREVGIRKTVGAMRHALIGQFLGESIVLAAFGFIIALVLVQASLPYFNTLTGKQLALDHRNAYFWIASLAFIVLTGFLAGSYPAFFLSSFKPVKVLKGTFKAAHALVAPRKVLVVVQFTFAIVLIISTVIVRQQIAHAQQRQLGYNKDNLIYVNITGDIEKNYPMIRRELLSGGAASSVCRSACAITQSWGDSWDFHWRGKDPNDKTTFDFYGGDERIVETTGLSLVSGRDFDLSKFPSDSFGVILNESAVKAMALKAPLGETIENGMNRFHVIGVTKDFILHSPYHATRPMVIMGCGKKLYSGLRWLNVLHIKLNAANSTAANLEKTEAIFKTYNPAFPFQSRFVDEEYAQKFDNEKRVGSLATLFAALTIFISCLGLIGLSAYMAESRIREIGVRKVLGASVASIAALLSTGFLKLVLIAFAVASPLAWWFMHNWLSDYPYRVEIHWWVFAVAGLAALIVSLITVSYQSIKAALTNPVKNLRTE